jgi:hypothetical protein
MILDNVNKFFQEKFGRTISEEEFKELQEAIEKDDIDNYYDEMRQALDEAGICACADMSGGFNCVCPTEEENDMEFDKKR